MPPLRSPPVIIPIIIIFLLFLFFLEFLEFLESLKYLEHLETPPAMRTAPSRYKITDYFLYAQIISPFRQSHSALAFIFTPLSIIFPHFFLFLSFCSFFTFSFKYITTSFLIMHYLHLIAFFPPLFTLSFCQTNYKQSLLRPHRDLRHYCYNHIAMFFLYIAVKILIDLPIYFRRRSFL